MNPLSTFLFHHFLFREKTKKEAYNTIVSITGFPIKDACFSKLKDIFDLLSDNKEGKLKKIWTENILAGGRLFWGTLYLNKVLKTRRM